MAMNLSWRTGFDLIILSLLKMSNLIVFAKAFYMPSESWSKLSVRDIPGRKIYSRKSREMPKKIFIRNEKI
jgi:hypothetical protein